MKLKLHGNSIRVRLNRREVARFAEEGRLEETFAYELGRRLAYGLESSADVSSVGVRVDDGGIFVVLPLGLAAHWTGGDQVGISGSVPLEGGQAVSVLVEKEFRRLHGANKDPDLYPNPLEKEPACA
jgi:hypothetical protein